MTDYLVSTKGLSCERDDRVLFEDLTLECSAGELIQIAGRNGAGKSTLLRIIAGIYTGFEGAINTAFFKHQLCYFGHKIPLKPSLTADENLSAHSLLESSTTRQQRSDALARFGLDDYIDVPCSDMSEGQRRRVGLSRIFLSKAKVFVLDEPFASLDKETVSFLEQVLVELSDLGNLVIFTSHHHIEHPRLKKVVLDG